MQSNRKGERGITLLLVAISLVVILGMAALAIDVVSLYVARTEAQRAADAAAMAAAKVIADTGFTSGLALTTTDVCGTGTSGAANQQAIAAAAQNLIAGQAASVQSVSCNLTNPQNPRVTVAIQRTGLPTFFSKIWGNTGNSVTATATAEAYNASFPTGGGSPGPSVSVGSVKPFLIPNCDPRAATPVAMCAPFYFTGSAAAGWSLNTSAAYIGLSVPLTQATIGSAKANQYLIANLSPPANICPAPSAPSCGTIPTGGLEDNIACARTQTLTCGNTTPVPLDPISGSPADLSGTITGLACLTHGPATSSVVTCSSPNTTLPQDCFVPGPPVTTIQGGTANPHPLLASQINISRSDSVVTVPVFDSSTATWCSNQMSCDIIGFLQLGIQDVQTNGTIDAVILNAAGCGPPTGTAISGGGVSPIPVRLVHN